MMFRFFFLGSLLAAASAPGAESLSLDVLKAGSQVYSNVTILGANATDLYFQHAGGFANVRLKYVSPELQKRFHYNAKAATEAERRRSEEDARYQNALAAQLAAQSRKAAAAMTAPAVAEESLADPISEKSFLGKPAPGLTFDKWLGKKPSLEGKFVLVSFWATWSAPCRKWIPELNAWQKKFADKLVVVGLSSESEAAIAGMSGPKIEFASAIDSEGRLSSAAGITSVPCVLLLDPKGIVRYQGHPAAITEKALEGLLAKAPEQR